MRKLRILGPATKVTFKMLIPEHDIARNRIAAAAMLREFANQLEKVSDTWLEQFEDKGFEVSDMGEGYAYTRWEVEYITAKEVYYE